jgi:hypothetical protein
VGGTGPRTLCMILATPIWVRSTGKADGKRTTAGVSRYDRVLSGGVIGDEYRTEDRPGAVDVNALFMWFAQAAGDVPADESGSIWTMVG